MGGSEQSHRGLSIVLFLFTILTPSTLESETFGAGESIILDGVFIQSKFGCVCWVIEWNNSIALAPTLDNFELLFPYINPVTLLVCIIGILSLIISWLVLTNRISFRKGLLIVLLCTFLLVLTPGINILRVERFYIHLSDATTSCAANCKFPYAPMAPQIQNP
jgi:hypothetical protein